MPDQVANGPASGRAPERLRPIYEDEDDLEAERFVIDLVCAKWRAVPRKLAIDEVGDYVIVCDGAELAIVEIKVRNNPRDQYPSYMLAKRKYDGLLVEAELRRIVALLVVRWTDAIGYAILPVESARFGTGGRRDRGDAFDIEPVVYVPIREFGLMRSALEPMSVDDDSRTSATTEV